MSKPVALLAAIGGGVLIAWIAASRVLSGGTVVVGGWPPADFARQFPDRQENESATRLLATTERIGELGLRQVRPAMNDYIRRELLGSSMPVAPPPDAVNAFLQKHANAIRTLRAQIAGNPPPVWSQQIDDILEPPTPPLGTHMQLFTLFAADALAEESRQNHAAAWTDLRAVWVLSRALWERPDIMSVLTAMVGSRTVAAVAAKLAVPPPPWWAEAAAFDVRPPLLRSMAYQAWAARTRAERFPAGEPDGSRFEDAVRRFVGPLLRPIRVVQAGVLVGRLRNAAAAAAGADPCVPFVIADAPEWAGVVRRFHRFVVEREGVAKFLDLEAQRMPSATSVCKDARWEYRRQGDEIELAFRGTVPPQISRVTVIPLAYRVTAERR